MKIKEIHGVKCVITEEGKIDGYICHKCKEQAWGKSVLSGVCVPCARELMEDMIIHEEDTPPTGSTKEELVKSWGFHF